MEILFLLIPLAVFLLVIAVGMFSWAVKSDQFEDLDREGRRILFEDDITPPPKNDGDQK